MSTSFRGTYAGKKASSPSGRFLAEGHDVYIFKGK